MPGPSAGIISGTLGGSNFRPGSIPAGLPTTIPIAGYPGVQPIVGLTTIINSTLNLAVNSGDAFVLATPELSTRSGGKAEFLAGGQVPIVSPASGTTPATVSFKDYGIKLTIEPRADESNNVSTSLNTEISSIDNSVAVAGNPGFLTRKTSSEFNVQAGQTIVISGLVNSDLSKDVSKLAGLGDIPVLGALFRSTNFRSGRTDLVILVTPMIIDPSEGGVKKALDIQERANGFAQEKGLLLK
jgi:pilus assembly protein CpaC